VNRIEWTIKSARQLRKLPHPAQVEIRDAVQEKLSVFPRCSGVKALVNHECGYRLRVGDYRVLFDFAGAIKLVRIEKVGKRDEHTY
jgi:mRNA-degrading endonuclease RelE of RelBE toxin-antitoxin system